MIDETWDNEMCADHGYVLFHNPVITCSCKCIRLLTAVMQISNPLVLEIAEEDVTHVRIVQIPWWEKGLLRNQVITCTAFTSANATNC